MDGERDEGGGIEFQTEEGGGSISQLFQRLHCLILGFPYTFIHSIQSKHG